MSQQRGGCFRWRSVTLGLIGLALAITARLAAQSSPHFEIVAIRPASAAQMRNGTFHGMGAVDPTRWRAQAVTVSPLVAEAFEIPWSAYDRVIGLPAWALSNVYEIDAVLPPHARQAQLPLMIRAMLADRFQLVAHLENRPMPAGTLRVAPGGAKLTRDRTCERMDLPIAINTALASGGRGTASPTAPLGCGEASRSLHDGTFEIRFHGMTMPQLADYLGYPNRTIVDQTGLKGAFDFTVHYAATPGPGTDDSQVQAYKRQTGLLLNRTRLTKLPVRVVVVDHIAPPKPN
jgi:uncharacterized protein (TIGR03435 family)